MAVAVDAISSVALASSGTTGTNSTLTIGAVVNPAILVMLVLSGGLQSVTMDWNGLALGQLVSVTGTNIGGATAYLFGVVNPATGNHTLTATWTTSANWVLVAMSFSGVDQVNGFENAIGQDVLTDINGNAELDITSAAGDIVVCLDGQDISSYLVPPTNGTEIFHESSLPLISAAANYLSGAALVQAIHHINAGGNTEVAMVGVSIHSAGGPPPSTHNEWLNRARRRGRR